jgi:hypothetical protein
MGDRTMVSVLALLCAAGIAPADCTRENAINVIANLHIARNEERRHLVAGEL